MFLCVRTILVHLGLFSLLLKLGAKRAELVQKFVPRSRVGIFRNQRIQSTPLDPELVFWCVLYNFGAFGTIWLSYETQCKTGRTGAKVRAPKSLRNFSQRRHPILPIGPKTNVLVHFIQFWCIGDRLVELRNSSKMGRNGAKVRATKSRRNYSQRTGNHPVGP
jgi:hypothetical protein